MGLHFCDESFSRRTFAYVALYLPYDGLERVERAMTVLKAASRIHGEVKWHNDAALRRPVLEIVARQEPIVRYFVVRRRAGDIEPERERRKCLHALFYDLSNPENPVRIVVLDERERMLTLREIHFLEELRSQMNLPPFLHASSKVVPGLEVADFVVGAIRSHEDGLGSAEFNIVRERVRLRQEIEP